MPVESRSAELAAGLEVERKAMLIDVAKCTGCERCVEACKTSHDLEPEIPARKQSRDGLSSRRLTTILPTASRRFVKKQCLHCRKPGCVDACLVGAIKKTKEGPVIYDAGKCIGCRYCMLACPLSIPRYEWDKRLPYMMKCDMCFGRLEEGRRPACVEACPNEACLYGDRETLMGLARERISKTPGKYLAHIYGEEELGGTSVMYISDTPLDVLGWPEKMGRRAMMSYTWPVMSKTPWLAAGVAGLLVGTYAVIQRRIKLQAEAAETALQEDAKTGDIEPRDTPADNGEEH